MERLQGRKKAKQISVDQILVKAVSRQKIRKSRARILVVDDEPRVAQTIRDLLMFAGFEVKTAHNGKQAIDLLESVDHFDLVITDMKMPEMDGMELLKLAQEFKKTLPVVVLTGCGTVDNGIHALEAGAYDYVLKPFNTQKLLLVVWQALRKSPAGVWAA